MVYQYKQAGNILAIPYIVKHRIHVCPEERGGVAAEAGPGQLSQEALPPLLLRAEEPGHQVPPLPPAPCTSSSLHPAPAPEVCQNPGPGPGHAQQPAGHREAEEQGQADRSGAGGRPSDPGQG